MTIPFLDSNTTFIRSGTIANGSCFFSAILQAYSRRFTRLSLEEQKDYIEKFRAQLADDFTLDKWISLSGGIISTVLIQQELYKNICNFFQEDFHLENISELDLQYLKALKDIIHIKEIETVLLPQIYSQTEGTEYKDTVENICTTYIKQNTKIKDLDEKRKTKLAFVFNLLLQTLIETSITNSYETYINKLKDCQTSVDMYLINYLMDTFDRDIYFLNSKTREPYIFGDNPYTGRKSIILLWFEQGHYEVIGRLLESNQIQREFDPSEPLISKIKNVYD